MKVVILVPRRAGREDRDRIWAFCKTWWENDHSWPLIEGHHENGPFNRATALNDAARRADEWDAAVCIDADVLIDAKQVRAAVSLALATGGPVLAYDTRIHLTTKRTKQILEGYRGNWLQGSGAVEATLTNSCSSAYVVTRELWDAVGGFDEQFSGWGWEDVAFRCATETVSGLELAQIAGKLFHLHHVVSAENNRLEATFVANQERGARYNQARFDLPAIEALLAESGKARPPFKSPEPVAVLAAGTIPRILHRTVPAETTAEVEAFWDTARELHPGWEFRTWRDPLDPGDWPLTRDVWAKCTSGAQRAGLIRLEALVRDGGIYLDSDVELYRPLDALLGVPAFAGWEDRKVVPDAVLGACAGHPVFERMLEQAIRAVLLELGAWESGPGVTTATLPDRPDVLLLPPGSFFPYHYSEKRRRNEDHATAQPWAFGAHHWAGSWLPPSQQPSRARTHYQARISQPA